MTKIGKGQRRGHPSRRADTAAIARDRILLDAARSFQAGRLADAETGARRLLAVAPDFPVAHQLLGMIAGQTNRPQLAIRHLREAVRLDPRSVDARNELAIVLRGDGDTASAIAQGLAAVRISPADGGTRNNLGLGYLAEGHLEEAAACFLKCIELAPALFVARYHLGIVRERQARDAEAESAYRKAIALSPAYGEAHARLGYLCLTHGRAEEAAACFRRAVASEPASTSGRAHFARILADVGQLAAAESCLRRAIAEDPGASGLHWQLGELHHLLGRFDDAAASFQKAIDLRPDLAAAWLSLVSARKVDPNDRPLLDRMSVLLATEQLTEHDRTTLHYALGKACDDLGDNAAAMDHFDTANEICVRRLRLTNRMIDRTRHANNIGHLIETFTTGFYSRASALSSASELPIFIVGMIRSGTTLTEQIVSSHPLVGAAGELRFWSDRSARAGDLAAELPDIPSAHRMADDYLALLNGLAPGMSRVTDKMPTNFMLLGLIHAIFPNARVIHCRRDPIDTCLSIYTTPYPNLPDFAHDRSNIVFYYQQYLRLMAHWRQVLPADRMLEVDYEEMVADRESVARRIIAFSGLDWDDACLRHETNERPIRTPSLWQARQPIYRTSVARWRRYVPWLREFGSLASET